MLPTPPTRGKEIEGCGVLIFWGEFKSSQGVRVQIIDQDYPGIPEVDKKLIELVKETGTKIVTNDFNLNKAAHSVESMFSTSANVPMH